MSVSIARQWLSSARTELERFREKQAAEEKNAAGLDKDANAKERNAHSTRSVSLRESYLKQAIKKREEANAARGRAARHAGEAAKAQKKVHDAETKLRAEEQLEARKAEEKRRAAEKKATIERERVDSRRESAQRKQMARLRTQIEDQARLLAAAPWDQTPETITVFFVASSPEDQDGLRIDKEMREIQQKVRMADHRDALRFQYAVAAQPADLLQRLNEVKPDIVHFSGHSGSAGLAMEDNDGLTRYLSTDELATLLSVSSRRIRLAVFNACESAEHALRAQPPRRRHWNGAIHRRRCGEELRRTARWLDRVRPATQESLQSSGPPGPIAARRGLRRAENPRCRRPRPGRAVSRPPSHKHVTSQAWPQARTDCKGPSTLPLQGGSMCSMCSTG
jgi:hypothetical protein